MQTFISMYLFTEMFMITGGAILLDGGQSLTPAKLVLEDCEISDARSSVSGGAIAQLGTSHLEVTRTLIHTAATWNGAYLAVVGPGKTCSTGPSIHLANPRFLT